MGYRIKSGLFDRDGKKGKMKKMKVIYILLIIFICGLIGTAAGELALQFIPPDSYFHFFLSSVISPFWEIKKIDLIVMKFGFNIQFNINPLTLVGIILGSIFSLRKV